MSDTTYKPLIDLASALEILEAVYSDGDPIKYHGVEMLVRDLLQERIKGVNSRRVKIQFFRNSTHRWTHGSVWSMVMDRLGVRL